MGTLDNPPTTGTIGINIFGSYIRLRNSLSRSVNGTERLAVSHNVCDWMTLANSNHLIVSQSVGQCSHQILMINSWLMHLHHYKLKVENFKC